jgi:1-acyl-sn-glycerol-3-phosphate acyltransferase
MGNPCFMRNIFAPRIPAGMSVQEARQAGILRPVGHEVPAARWADRVAFPLRLARCMARFADRRATFRGAGLGSPELREELRQYLGLLGLRLDVFGLERLVSGGRVLMWNQTSHLDHLVLVAAIPTQFRSIYNIEVARTPVYGPWLRRQEHFLVDRFDEVQWRLAVARAAAWAREGNTLLVSPEGTRSWDGEVLPMKRGAFILATLAGQPIVPIALYGAQRALPRGRAVVASGTIEVEFRPSIPTDGFTEERRGELSEIVRDAFRQAQREGPPSARRR